MNKNAYLAELTQLLYYMTPWDRDAAIEECRNRFDSCADPDQIARELGSPMKLAVTLHRTYVPAPEPVEGASVPSRLPPRPEPETPAPPANIPEPSDAPEAEAPAPDEESAPEPAIPVEGEAPEPAEDTAAETSAESEPRQAEDQEPAADQPAEESAPGEPVPPRNEPGPARTEPREEIFSEIFQAATMAQSAIVTASEPQEEVPATARLGILIPYTIACILLGIPVSLLLFAVDLLIFGIAVAALASGVYFLTFLVKPLFPTLGDKLVIIGLSILFITAAVAICALGIWFMKNAALGFTRFLVVFGREHGFQKEAKA